jgi:glycine cleavage system H lipoate-binding protein
MSSRVRRGIVHLFHPAQHLWLRVFPLPTLDAIAVAAPAVSRSIGVEMGLTARGLDEVGDIISLRRLMTPEQQIKAGETILTIEWEGHTITSADELYHTVWETLEGTTAIRSPVNGIVEDISDDINLDENSILVRMATTLDDLERATSKEILLKETDYARVLMKISPGMFKDV